MKCVLMGEDEEEREEERGREKWRKEKREGKKRKGLMKRKKEKWM